MTDKPEKAKVNAWISRTIDRGIDELVAADGDGGVVRSDVARAALTAGLSVLGQLPQEDRMARYGAERLAL